MVDDLHTCTSVDLYHLAQQTPVAAARGELVHVQVQLVGSSGGAVTAHVGGASTLGAVTVRRVGYTRLNVTFGAGRPAGLYPSVLVPLGANGTSGGAHQLHNDGHAYHHHGRVGVEHKGHSQGGGAVLEDSPPPVVFWLSVRVPRSAPRGLHTATLHVSGRGCAAPVAAPVQFRVSGLAIPLPGSGNRSQTTGASFQVSGIERFGPPGSDAPPAPETAMEYFRSMKEQGVDS